MSNRKKATKIFLEWNYEKEEQWLNEMVDSGWMLAGTSWGGLRYEFEPCTPGEYTIRMVMAEKEDDPQLADAAAAGGEQFFHHEHWYYFRKKKADGDLVVFRDIDAQITHIDKVSKYMLATIAPIVPMWIILDAYIPLAIFAVLILGGYCVLQNKKKALQKKKENDTDAKA